MRFVLVRLLVEYLLPVVLGSVVAGAVYLFHLPAILGVLVGSYFCYRVSKRESRAFTEILRDGERLTLNVASYLLSRVVINTLPMLLVGGLGYFFTPPSQWITFAAWLVAEAGWNYLLSLSPEMPERGRELLTHAEAEKLSISALPPGDAGIPFGGVLLPSSSASLHFVVIGATGSGKSLTLRLLMQRALREIVPGSNARALVFDAKRDAMSTLAGMNLPCAVKTLSIFDKRGVAWDMAADIRDSIAAEAVASILIPIREGATQPYFDESSQALLFEAMNALIYTRPGEWTFADLILALGTRERLVALLERSPTGVDVISTYFSKPATAQDIMSTLSNRIRNYRAVAAAWSSATDKMSLRDWVDGEFVLVLGNSHIARPAVKAVNRVLFHRLTQMLLEEGEKPGRRTWVVLDELRQAGGLGLESIGDLAVEGRSRGVSLVIGTQDVEGLEAVYGKEEARELLGQCAHKAILRLGSPGTAEWAASLFGEREGRECSRTSGQGGDNKHESLVTREAVLPSEFLKLPQTTKETGLSGFYVSPSVGAWFATIAGKVLEKTLLPPSREVPDMISREPGELVLSAPAPAPTPPISLKSLRSVRTNGAQV